MLSSKVALYLYKCNIWPCMEYYFYARAGAPNCYLNLLNKLHKRVGLLDLHLLLPLAHCQNVASSSFFFRIQFGICSSELTTSVSLPYFCEGSTCYSNLLHSISVTRVLSKRTVARTVFKPSVEEIAVE